MKYLIPAILIYLFLMSMGRAETVSLTLYNGIGLPTEQGSLVGRAITNLGGLPFFVAFNQTALTPDPGAQVDTAANNAEYSGYTSHFGILSLEPINPDLPVLDRDLGYSIFFNVTLDSTTNNSDDRAAFNVITISSDQQGIELGFESQLIFAQNANFTRAESVPYPTQDATDFTLQIHASGYQLIANSTVILSGPLRGYVFDPFSSNPPLPSNPYTTPNFIFFGDNTGQEFGQFTLRSASLSAVLVNPTVAIPVLNPWSMGVLALWLIFFSVRPNLCLAIKAFTSRVSRAKRKAVGGY